MLLLFLFVKVKWHARQSDIWMFLVIIGTSGSGKSHASMLLLRQLFAVAGGGPETDAFKHLAAAFTVLRSLGSAKTATNSESSRIVSFKASTVACYK